VVGEVSLDHRLHDHAEGVEGGADTEQDEHDREDLPARVQRLDLAEADRRDGGDRLVDGLEQGEPEEQVADDAEHGDAGQRRQRQPDPSQSVTSRG
jgi:hypothetical protein